jgi:dissimilatory sulfite reductase related protein
MPSSPTTASADVRLELNEEGFLRHPELWDDEVAAILAREAEGIDALGEKHWAIVRFIRAHWLEKGMAPMIRALCQHSGVRLREVYELFPSGPAKGACKVAGLPKPDGCV